MRDRNQSITARSFPWVVLFGVWLLLLSGIFSPFFGSPGVVQALQLRALKVQKVQHLAEIQKDKDRLEQEENQLTHNTSIQLKEVRRVLGYAGKDELIFEFH